MEWDEIVRICYQVHDASEIMGKIPERLTCGCYTHEKAIEMNMPRVFLLAVFNLAAKEGMTRDEVLVRTREIMDPLGYPHEFILKLHDQNEYLVDVFFQLLG